MKAELKRADVTYEELARRLSEMGFRETKASVASKLSRGLSRHRFPGEHEGDRPTGCKPRGGLSVGNFYKDSA